MQHTHYVLLNTGSVLGLRYREDQSPHYILPRGGLYKPIPELLFDHYPTDQEKVNAAAAFGHSMGHDPLWVPREMTFKDRVLNDAFNIALFEAHDEHFRD